MFEKYILYLYCITISQYYTILMLYSNTSSQMCNLILLIKCLTFNTAKTFVGILASCLFILIYSTLILPLVVSDWTQCHEYIFIPYLFPIFPYLLLYPHPCLCHYVYAICPYLILYTSFLFFIPDQTLSIHYLSITFP